MEISVLHEDCPNLSTMFIKQKYRVIDYRNFCIQAFIFFSSISHSLIYTFILWISLYRFMLGNVKNYKTKII